MLLPIIMSVISFICFSGYAKWKKQKEMSATKINQNISKKIKIISKLNQELKIILKDIHFIDHILSDLIVPIDKEIGITGCI